MKREPWGWVGVFRAGVALLLALSCFVMGCGKRSQLRQNGTVDVGGVKMEFVLIQPGVFKMGSEDRDPKEFTDEKPRHEVTLTRPFYLGKYEVTQEQWLKVMKQNPSEFEGPDLPVENVSWEDAQMFVQKLSEKTGEKFVLPTEAQWEYACRAGVTTRFSWGEGETEVDEYAWYADNSGRETHPGGEKKSNAWGLYDMSGNVWEWCADSYTHYFGGAETDPVSAAPGGLHVVRGGGCSNKIGGMRPSNRSSEYRGNRLFGIRCAVLVDENVP